MGPSQGCQPVIVTPQVDAFLLYQVPKLAVVPLDLLLFLLVPLCSAVQLLVFFLVLEEAFRICGKDHRLCEQPCARQASSLHHFTTDIPQQILWAGV